MKRQWDSEELVEHFTLLPDESILLDNLSGSNRLGFALLLKFFQIEARFPISKQEIPKSVVSYIAKQVDVSPRTIKEYSFSGRTIERHRSQIRQFFGFRETTVEDAFELTKWLQEKVLAYDRQESHLEAAAYQRLRSLKLEPPSPDRIERLIRSAVRTCEETFCSTIFEQLSSQTLIKLDALLRTDGALEDEQSQLQQSDFNVLKTDPGRTSLDSILKEAQKLNCIRQLGLPSNLFALVSPKVVYHYRRRASAEPPRELRRHPDPIRYTLVAAFCWQRSQEITDSLVELLIQIIHRIGINAERRVDKELIDDFKRVNGKSHLLFRIAEASLDHPLELVKDVVYPVVSQKTLQDVVKEYKSTGPTYRAKVYTVMRASYLHHYRRMVPQLLDTLEFRSNNGMHRPVISALELLKKYKGSTQHYYSPEDKIFINGVLKSGSHDLIVEVDKDGT